MAKLNKPPRNLEFLFKKFNSIQNDLELLRQDVEKLYVQNESFNSSSEFVNDIIFKIYKKIYEDPQKLSDWINSEKTGGNLKSDLKMFVQLISYAIIKRNICSVGLLAEVLKVERASIYYYCKVAENYLETDSDYKQYYAIINSIFYDK